MTIAFLGDSLLDTGNLSLVLAQFDIEPFPELVGGEFIYNDGKASNGLVLGEAVIQELGIEPDTVENRFPLTFGSGLVNPFQDNLNYAFAGSTAGIFGSEGNQLEDLPIGLQTQVTVLKYDLALANRLSPQAEKPDIILSAGSNDVFEALVDIESFAGVLLTPETTDDDALKDDLASGVVDNINRAIARMQNHVDDIVVFGLSKLGDTPFAIQVDAAVDALLPGDFANRTRTFLTGVAAEVNTRLTTRYNPSDDVCDDYRNWLAEQLDDLLPTFGPASWGYTTASTIFEDLNLKLPPGSFFDQARDWLTGIIDNWRGGWLGPCNGDDPAENVLVIDGIEIFETGLPEWVASLEEGLMPITELSFRDYVTQAPEALPADLIVDQFAFIDGSHPTDGLNQVLGANIAELIAAEFPDFGQG
jgi:hypothetical protein